jgi:propionaldehyde dehydrogenase
MDHLEKNIRQLVQEVIRDMNLFPSKKEVNPEKTGIFSNINEAIRAAGLAFMELNNLTLETRKNIIANIRKTALANNEMISRMAHEETGLGRWEDKIIKNELGISKTPGVEDIVPESWSDDNGLTLVERAPYGVIGSITPSTNPAVTIISNSIGMIAAGNAVVFNPHPSAKKVSAWLITLLNNAITEAGKSSGLH